MKRFDSASMCRQIAASLILFCIVIWFQTSVVGSFAAAATIDPAADENKAPDPDAALDDLKPKADDNQLKDESAALDPGNKDALAWYMAGQKAMKRGDLQPAADAFEKAAEASPKSAVPLRALSIVLIRLGST